MRYTALVTTVVMSVTLAGCGGNLSTRNARTEIAALGGATLAPDDVQVQRIVSQVGNRAIAETTVRMAFQFERDADGDWRIVAARLGDRQWVQIDELLRAVDLQRADRTVEGLAKLAAGVAAYRRENGVLPTVAPDGHVSDVLHPAFMPELVREDGWGSRIGYEAAGAGFRLSSPGPDRITGNGDDIVFDGEEGAGGG